MATILMSLWNLHQDYLTGDKVTSQLQQRIIYFPQERADVFTVHEQLPHQESWQTSYLFNYSPSEPGATALKRWELDTKHREDSAWGVCSLYKQERKRRQGEAECLSLGHAPDPWQSQK